MSVKEYAAPILLSVLAFTSMGGARAQSPADDGQWSAPFPLPLIAIHSAMLPTGKVLLFSAEHGVPRIHGWLLDPETLALKNVRPPAGWNPDCAGKSFLADGRLLAAGGTLQFNPLLGSKKAFIFDSFAETSNQIEDMAQGRWYPKILRSAMPPDGGGRLLEWAATAIGRPTSQLSGQWLFYMEVRTT